MSVSRESLARAAGCGAALWHTEPPASAPIGRHSPDELDTILRVRDSIFAGAIPI